MARPFRDYTGEIHGAWTVLHFHHRDRYTYWTCRCRCGVEQVVRISHVVGGTSLGCRECWYESTRTVEGGAAHHPLYRTYRGMLARCYNVNHDQYNDYGGRGITVCERWLDSFPAFVKDMGPKPDAELTLDRVNNDLGYSPSNCRWATREQQIANRRQPNRELLAALGIAP